MPVHLIITCAPLLLSWQRWHVVDIHIILQGLANNTAAGRRLLAVIDTITVYYVMANVPSNESQSLSSNLETNSSQASFKALLISKGAASSCTLALLNLLPSYLNTGCSMAQLDGNVHCTAGFQVTAVELIQVSNGGIVIPVATVVTESSGGGGGISGGAIAGIVVGVIGGLALIGRESDLPRRPHYAVLSLPCVDYERHAGSHHTCLLRACAI